MSESLVTEGALNKYLEIPHNTNLYAVYMSRICRKVKRLKAVNRDARSEDEDLLRHMISGMSLSMAKYYKDFLKLTETRHRLVHRYRGLNYANSSEKPRNS